MSPENVIVCGHPCCPTPESTKDRHFHRDEPFECVACIRLEATHSAEGAADAAADAVAAAIAGDAPHSPPGELPVVGPR